MMLMAALVTIACHPRTQAATWTEKSFDDFVDGAFLDAGSNSYVSERGRIQIITRWDLNGDGYLDILMPSGQQHEEKCGTYLYLNTDGCIDGRSRIELPASGSIGGLVHDFDRDGYNDLAVANHSNSHSDEVNTYIYRGGPEGYSAGNRLELPAFLAAGIAAGDFNHDGWDDLAIACRWQKKGPSGLEGPIFSFIYWNSPDGFLPDKRQPLAFDGGEPALCVLAGDLDKDNHDDLVISTASSSYFYYSSHGAFEDDTRRVILPLGFSAAALGDFNGDELKDIAVCAKGGLVILPRGQDGYSVDKAVQRPVSAAQDVAAADFNADGLDDIAVANNHGTDGAPWTDSLVFLSGGDALVANEPARLPTLGASGVSAGDLNGDGFPELVISNRSVLNYLNLLSYVFWNDHGTFHANNRTQLPTHETRANTIGDVNNDGRPDVVFFNMKGGIEDGPLPSYLYWGNGTREFSEKRAFEFTAGHLFGCGHADLDDDGFVDMVLAQNVTIAGVPSNQNGIIAYWGEKNGFSPPTYLTMDRGYGGVRIADINRDGWLDILAGGRMGDPAHPDKFGFPIFWGSRDGFRWFDVNIFTTDNTEIVRAPLLMDLNRDGWLDVAAQVQIKGKPGGPVTIWWGSKDGFSDDRTGKIDLGQPLALMYLKGADLNRDGWLDLLIPNRGTGDEEEKPSYIYYGSPSGFNDNHREILLGTTPYDNAIADFDRDGWLDVFLCAYGAIEGNKPSLIYWGNKEGFGKRPRTELPTYGSSGAEALDYDGDGWLDLLIANHRQGGCTDRPIPHRHRVPSMLYWGGPDGFSPQRRLEIPSIGPSGLNVRDAGNSYDRGLYEDYISSPYPVPAGERPTRIEWTAETPHGTAVRFQVRAARTDGDLASSMWCGPQGQDTWYTEPGPLTDGIDGPWIQYRARLITPNGAATPYLTRVTIETGP
jgi:hypothetical protein